MTSIIVLMPAYSLQWNMVPQMVDHIARTIFVSLQAVRVLVVGSLLNGKWDSSYCLCLRYGLS